MFKLLFLLAVLLAVFNPVTQVWLAEQLVVDDGLQPSDAIVALRGGDEQRPRIDEAVSIFHRKYAEKFIADVSSTPVFGHPEGDLVTEYLKKKMVGPGDEVLCENGADSTAEEALAVRDCLLRIGAKSVIVVTSEYHTRRTRFLFRRALGGTGIIVRVHPVYNKEFWDPHWWQRRRWAKTMITECEKSVWTLLEAGIGRLRNSAPQKVSAANEPGQEAPAAREAPDVRSLAAN